MLFSYNQLSKLVDLSKFDVNSVISRLTFSGFEVEGVEHLASGSRLVIGKILTCEKHPDSDHLHLLTVDCGSEGILDIVCGAKNARVGIKVIVALVGCELPHLGITIKAGKIRGYESNGMCCSLLELGVNKEVLPASSPSIDGIEELSDDAVVGNHDVLSYLHLDDVILDVNVLPNRPDCLSYIGFARELAALLDTKLVDIPTFKNVYNNNIKSESKSDKCARFDVLEITDIVKKESSSDLVKATLMANGIRVLNPLVDLGNYIMLLTGEPLNIYDAKLNPSREYYCIDNYEDEFTCFDGKKVKLIKDDLLIVDKENKPLSLAGIMAGENASVTSSCNSIVIEAADFYHANIRHTCSRLGLSSFSSQLFAKGRNPNMIDEALAVLIASLDEFFTSYRITSYCSHKKIVKENKPFFFSLEALNKRLGSSYSQEEVDKVLNAYRIKKVDESHLLAPIDRVDLNEQCDVEEEVFRYYPASKVNPTLENLPITKGGLSNSQYLRRQIRQLLVDKGFNEILSFTLISEKEDQFIRVFSDKESYRIINPMTKDHEIVRSDLLPSMVSTINYNASYQNNDLALFEISDIDTPYGNHLYLSLGLKGMTSLSEKYQSRPYNFFDLKGAIEAIFAKIGLPASRYQLKYSTNDKFHPKASADIFIGKDKVGTFGQLHPSYSKDKLFLAEIDLGYLFELKGLKTKFTAFSSFPLVRRDLSFKVNDDITYEQIKKKILSLKNTYLKSIYYFDDFKDKDTKERYLGISLLLGKEDGTLNDAEINNTLNIIINELKASLGLTIRGI